MARRGDYGYDAPYALVLFALLAFASAIVAGVMLSAHESRQAILFALFAAIGIGAHLAGISDGWLFLAWLAVGVTYHVVFGSGLVLRRRSAEREDTGAITGRYWTLWKQR